MLEGSVPGDANASLLSGVRSFPYITRNLGLREIGTMSLKGPVTDILFCGEIALP